MWQYIIVIVLLIVLVAAYFNSNTNSHHVIDSMIIHEGDRLLSDGVIRREILVENQRICIVSGSISGKEFREYSIHTKKYLQEYAEYHGYDFQYFEEYITQAPAIWQKIYAVKLALQQCNDVVVWMDDDVYVKNQETSIENFLRMSNKSIILSEDIRGKGRIINSGVFILRNNQKSVDFISDIERGRTKLFSGVWNNGLFHEQSVMTYYALSKYKDDVTILRKGILQSYTIDNSCDSDSFICHMAGETIARRNEIMDKYRTE